MNKQTQNKSEKLRWTGNYHCTVTEVVKDKLCKNDVTSLRVEGCDDGRIFKTHGCKMDLNRLNIEATTVSTSIYIRL